MAVVFVGFLPLLQIYYFNIGRISHYFFSNFHLVVCGVAQNPRLIHFLRYNAMQALLLSIFAALCSLVLSLLGMSQQALFGGFSGNFAGSSNFLLNTINSVIFLFVAGSSIFSVVQCIRGLYAEIPVISEAAYSQVR
ncbi:MAG: hypothetical protein HC784_06510 [Hydrococcus sp. CSU_1_8]|nr:hypothetical protein [Hydrococcus sp. CSU_1_8]